ncbi:MAG TPA: DNA lyase [Solirubrobacteraceae bacterium]|nr:DNA lyase [Solirubrobacteraceae bacterium]
MATSAVPAPTRARVARLRARLAEVYGVPEMPPHGDPIAELVLTVLSQSTNDRNRDVAYLRLRERFPAWSDVRDAPVAAVEEAIRPGGISKVKSARIRDILAALPVDERGAPTLAALPGLPLADARALLCALPGVGRKTAACVLLFSYGLRDVPVDTHVGRVGARLGLLPARGSADAIHDAMLALTPPGAELELHVNLLRHGRRTCHAQRPRCSACALGRMCPRIGVRDAR